MNWDFHPEASTTPQLTKSYNFGSSNQSKTA